MDKPRFESLMQHWLSRLGDVLLKWCLHEWLWYFIGLSAVLIHKDYLNKEYLHVRIFIKLPIPLCCLTHAFPILCQMWRSRGVRVLAWTVNNSQQRAYLSNYLGVESMSDTMDRLPLRELLRMEGDEEDEGKVERDEGTEAGSPIKEECTQ